MELRALLEEAGFRLDSQQTLAGGDINQVFKVRTDQGPLVVKLNSASRFPAMFQAEAQGLQLLAQADQLRIPRVIQTGAFKDHSYLILEFLEGRDQAAQFWEDFGRGLAGIHRHSQPQFGLDHNNYIGSLPQVNTAKEEAADFYLNQRLLPQVQLARKQGYSLPQFEALAIRLPNLIPDEPPALIHGDLWGGNFIVGPQGEPVLIDPAVAYAPREMDLGMMHLFGGFHPQLFEAYQEAFPLSPGWKDRLALWQLYYLLVHLNLFGGSYLDGVKRIIGRYC